MRLIENDEFFLSESMKKVCRLGSFWRLLLFVCTCFYELESMMFSEWPLLEIRLIRHLWVFIWFSVRQMIRLDMMYLRDSREARSSYNKDRRTEWKEWFESQSQFQEHMHTHTYTLIETIKYHAWRITETLFSYNKSIYAAVYSLFFFHHFTYFIDACSLFRGLSSMFLTFGLV